MSPPIASTSPYRVVPANLRLGEIAEADRLVTILRDAGWPRPTRSLVIRQALSRLREDLTEKTAEEIFRYFMDHRAK